MRNLIHLQCQSCDWMWTNGTLFENIGFKIKNGILVTCPNCKIQYNKNIINAEEYSSVKNIDIPSIPEDFHPDELIES